MANRTANQEFEAMLFQVVDARQRGTMTGDEMRQTVISAVLRYVAEYVSILTPQQRRRAELKAVKARAKELGIDIKSLTSDAGAPAPPAN